jgi:hypothetical protein
MGFPCTDVSNDPLPSRRGFCFSVIIIPKAARKMTNRKLTGELRRKKHLRMQEELEFDKGVL